MPISSSAKNSRWRCGVSQPPDTLEAERVDGAWRVADLARVCGGLALVVRRAAGLVAVVVLEGVLRLASLDLHHHR